MWHKLEFSSESIDKLKMEMQRLQDEGKRLLSESRVMEQEETALASDYRYVFQRDRHGESSRAGWSPFC